jgi:hypothetical protein
MHFPVRIRPCDRAQKCIREVVAEIGIYESVGDRSARNLRGVGSSAKPGSTILLAARLMRIRIFVVPRSRHLRKDGRVTKCNPFHTWKRFLDYIQQGKYKIPRDD